MHHSQCHIPNSPVSGLKSRLRTRAHTGCVSDRVTAVTAPHLPLAPVLPSSFPTIRYITEVVAKERAGALIALYELSATAGVLMAYTMYMLLADARIHRVGHGPGRVPLRACEADQELR